MSETNVIIGTRGSALALAQATLVRDLLRRAFPKLGFELKIIKTTGDKLKTASLRQVSGSTKGLFTKELEQALLRARIDLAVHSCKDLPGEIPAGLKIAAIPKREDARDVFISKTKMALPSGGVIATSSVRRACQLLARSPQLQIEEIRGNIETRLRKLADSESWQGIILAAAGLKRLNILNETKSTETLQFDPPLHHRFLPFDVMLPAVGQAALAIETRADDSLTGSIVTRLNHFASFAAVSAERAFLRELGGGCQIPAAAYGVIEQGKLRLRGAIFEEDGSNPRRGEVTGGEKDFEPLGRKLAQQLK